MLKYNDNQNELYNELPLFMLDSEHLAELKKQTKASKGQRLGKDGKKALKLFRKNRQNKRHSL